MAGRDNEWLADWLKQRAHMLHLNNGIAGKAFSVFEL